MEFDLQPTLTGELLELRPLKQEDFDALFRAASDPLIWELHPDRERYKEGPFRKYFDSGIASGGAFAIVERKTGRVIGSSRYHDLTPEQVEVGFTFLERAFWGGTYNAELKKLMLDHAFRFVKRVVLVVGEENLRSRRAVEKIGGKLIASEDRVMNGKTVRHVIYAVERCPSMKPTAEQIVGLERKALDRWGAGDPGGYLDTYADDVTYFDPTTAARVDGLEAMREYYRPWTGKIQIDRYEIVNPRVVATDDMAVLSYNLVNFAGEKVLNRWNSTAVYRREGGEWKIVQTHWSYVQPKIVE